MFSWARSNELSANEISGFLNQLYLKSNYVNQRSFFHAEEDWKKIKGDLKIFSWVWSNMLSTNQITEFLN